MVLQSKVAGDFFARFVFVSQETENAEPIVNADVDDAFFGNRRAVVNIILTAAAEVCSAVNVDYDGQFLIFRRLSPDVQAQAIFAHQAVIKIHVHIEICVSPRVEGRSRFILNGDLSKLCTISDALPRFNRLRLAPTIFSRCRVGIRNSFENFNSVFNVALNCAAGNFHLRRSSRVGRYRQKNHHENQQ